MTSPVRKAITTSWARSRAPSFTMAWLTWVRAVAGLGQPYRAMPGKDGYLMAPFDLTRDRPTHGRGGYVRTDEVQRLDLSQLHGGSNGRA